MATATFRCGHPRTPENSHSAGGGRFQCATCSLRRAAGRFIPTPCGTCGAPLPGGSSRYCNTDCEPTTCTCDTPRPDGLGECAGCHRLVLTHSWHNGRPEPVEQQEAC